MHPVILIVPAAVLIIGPRMWVNRVLRQHNRKEEDFPDTARDLARKLLDSHQCRGVRVEDTDLGDHYDPQARAVRLARDKIDRRTLTAITTAAHEVSHALQHAEGYQPFLLRRKLATVARVVGEAGMVTLLAAPAIALISRQPLPPRIAGTAALAMLGTGMAAQLSALPTEIDASFKRALPMLRDGYFSEAQLREAKKILAACSLTYIASSMVTVLNIWPWLGRRPALSASLPVPVLPPPAAALEDGAGTQESYEHPAASCEPPRRRRRGAGGRTEVLIRHYGKPLIRSVLRYSRRRTNK
jgi:Zn-dependent membrane protease YugP